MRKHGRLWAACRPRNVSFGPICLVHIDNGKRGDGASVGQQTTMSVRQCREVSEVIYDKVSTGGLAWPVQACLTAGIGRKVKE